MESIALNLLYYWRRFRWGRVRIIYREGAVSCASIWRWEVLIGLQSPNLLMDLAHEMSHIRLNHWTFLPIDWKCQYGKEVAAWRWAERCHKGPWDQSYVERCLRAYKEEAY